MNDMKRLFIILLILFLVISPTVLAQDDLETEANEEATNIVEETTENNTTTSSAAADNSIVWEDMNEMQIALFMINKQIDYLMDRIEDSESRVNNIIDTYEERLEKETARNTTLTLEYDIKIAELDSQISDYRAEVSKLEREAAIFASESGLYLKIVIGFLAGAIAGVLLAGILNTWKKRGIHKKSASA